MMTKKITNTKVILRDSKGRFMSNVKPKAVTTKTNNLHSSFIKSVKIDGTNINVVMERSPKIVYTYKPTQDGLKEVKKVLTQGGSLGIIYNKHLRGKELSRTIYK